MLIRDVYDAIERMAPFERQDSWDNSGLLVGGMEREVNTIITCVDVSDEVVDFAIENRADLIIAHHPLIFRGMKRINDEDFIGRRIIKLVKHDISLIAAHTNADMMLLAKLSAQMLGLTKTKVLEVTGNEGNKEYGYGEVGNLPSKMSLRECAELVKKTFELESVRIFGDLDKQIEYAAISPGSGKSFIDVVVANKCDVYITGDIDHHNGIDAVARNTNVIDAGHYGIEKIFAESMKQYIEKEICNTNVICYKGKNPFVVM